MWFVLCFVVSFHLCYNYRWYLLCMAQVKTFASSLVAQGKGELYKQTNAF